MTPTVTSNSGRPTDPQGANPARRLTWLYSLALGLIAALTVISHAFVDPALTAQKRYAPILDDAGRQRMLSQEISKAALAIRLATDGAELQQRANELEEALNEWEHTHRRLSQGAGKFDLPAGVPQPIALRLESLEPHFRAIHSAGTALVRDAQDKAPAVLDDEYLAALVAPILEHEPAFLTGMDDIVALYRQDAVQQARALRRTHRVLTAVILAALLLTGILVFRPAAATIRRQFNELRESEQRFRVMADSAPVMIWLSGTDKGCTYFNRGWLAFTGRPLARELGDGWLQGVHEQDRAVVHGDYSEAFDRKDTFRLEYRLRRHDGQFRWILDIGVPRRDATGRFQGYVGSCIDITDHKQVEQVLARARDELEARVQERTANLLATNAQLEHEVAERKRVEQELVTQRETLRAVLDNAPIGIWMLDRDGRLRFVNQTLCQWAGQQEAIHLDPTRCAERVGRDIAAVLSAPAIDVPEPGATFHSKHRVRFTDGDAHDLEVTRALVSASDGESLGVLGLARDVTARDRAEEQARQHQAALAHVARLSTMGEMASSIAHELNQPLAAIANYAAGCVRRLERGVGAPEDLLPAMQQVAVQANRAGAIIRRVRDFVRKEEPRRAWVDVNQVIREVVQMVSTEAHQRGATIRIELADALPPVLADAIQLEQVVLNLLRNGLEAMHGTTRAITVRTMQTEGRVQVDVQDTGPGLNSEAIERLFEPFFTTKPGGMGMGLSISRSIVEAYEGRLWSEPLAGGGALFRFYLPATLQPANGNR